MHRGLVMQRFILAFESVPDPRAENARHDLADILVIAFLSVLCGATSCSEMAEFGRTKIRFLRRFLSLTHGIPSHDTFSCIFRMLDAKALDAAFGSLTATLMKALADGGVIAIDGKSLKGAHAKGEAYMPRMMVTAYAADLRLTLASLEAEGGSEVEAALGLIGLIDLKGYIVTADALHCHRRMAQAVIGGGGDYCFTLKGNRERLLSDARARLAEAGDQHPTATSRTKGHGRVETRVGSVVEAPGFADRHDFPGLKAFGRIEATRAVDGDIVTDVRIFALSRELSPEALLKTVRAHWDIENGLHWQLDVTLREDAARNRKDNGPANIAVLRRRALDVARRDTSKGSLSIKIKRAGWDHDFLLHMLRQMR
jgi:predicted transposase YbfD/YdcC